MINNEDKIDTCMWLRCLEAGIEILLKLAGLLLVYKVGAQLMSDQSGQDTLFSILLLPTLLILKNGHVFLEPFTIRAYLTSDDVTVKSGLLTRKSDTLKIETLENIELVKTPLGRIFTLFGKGYGTLNLYAYGGTVIMPYLKNPEIVQQNIEEILNKIKQDKQKNTNQITNSNEH